MKQSDFQSLANIVAQEGTPADILINTLKLIKERGPLGSEEYRIRCAALNISWIKHFRLKYPVVEAEEF